ncbi:MAG: YigZ family protein [Candidatus Cloacimonetes bacterium]|nr:YigZ family protein [Candidatus Cloacimonadota bacterium]
MEYFYSVKSDHSFEEKIKRSRFIAHLHYSETLVEAKDFIHQINLEYKTANHNCWAYIVGKNAENEHYSDAGEPAGSAGKPILNSLKKFKTTNITAVVTRYFGGVKLGIRGLIDAYGSVVEKALADVELRKLVETELLEICTSYDFCEKLKYDLRELGAEIVTIDYLQDVTLHLEVELKHSELLRKYLESLAGEKKVKF